MWQSGNVVKKAVNYGEEEEEEEAACWFDWRHLHLLYKCPDTGSLGLFQMNSWYNFWKVSARTHQLQPIPADMRLGITIEIPKLGITNLDSINF